MTPDQFKHWVAGFMAALDGKEMTPAQAAIIADKARSIGSPLSVLGPQWTPAVYDRYKTVSGRVNNGTDARTVAL